MLKRISGAADRLLTFTDSFSRFFCTRSDTHAEEIRAYLSGLLQGKRGAKNMERMEEHVSGFHYQRVHHSISSSPWEHRPLMDEIARRADGLLGGAPRPRLVIDDSGFQKKGTQSVGVARQYIGRLGKVENCQIAVCTSLASGQQSMLSDVRLYLPEAWCEDAARCEKAGIPEAERHFKTKHELALQSVRHQRALGVRFAVVAMDSGYGSSSALLRDLDRDGETYVAETHCNMLVWRDAPWHHQQAARGKAPLKTPRASHPGQRIDAWAAEKPRRQWRRLKVRGSDQGWVEVNYLAQRLWVREEGQEQLRWALVWEDPHESPNDGSKPDAPRTHYALSNASADEDPRVLVADGVQRNVIERNFRDAKSELGMGDYQTRGWQAWQHHMALVMLLMLFVTQEKMHSPQVQSPEGQIHITVGDLTFVLERLLPSRTHARVRKRTVKAQLQERLAKRYRDQVARRKKTRHNRPALYPDEVLPT